MDLELSHMLTDRREIEQNVNNCSFFFFGVSRDPEIFFCPLLAIEKIGDWKQLESLVQIQSF